MRERADHGTDLAPPQLISYVYCEQGKLAGVETSVVVFPGQGFIGSFGRRGAAPNICLNISIKLLIMPTYIHKDTHTHTRTHSELYMQVSGGHFVYKVGLKAATGEEASNLMTLTPILSLIVTLVVIIMNLAKCLPTLLPNVDDDDSFVVSLRHYYSSYHCGC